MLLAVPDGLNVASVPNPKFVLDVDAEATSDKLLAEARYEAPDTYAATHADPVYKRISGTTVL